MNLRNWGVSGGVGFGGTGPAAILGVGLHPPPGKVKNPGEVRAKKARCSLRMLPRDGIDQKTGQNFDWSFFKQNDTKLEAKLHFF